MSSSTAPESTSSTAVKEEVRFVQPAVHSTLHHDAPYLRLETPASQPVVEPSFPQLEYFTSASSSSPGPKRIRTDYSSGSASVSASILAGSSVSYPFSEEGRCCPVGCTGKQCERIRLLSKVLMAEIAVHEMLVHGVGRAPEVNESIPGVITDVLDIVVDRLKQSNISLKKLLDESPIKPEVLNKTTSADPGVTKISAMELPQSPVLHRASTSPFNPLGTRSNASEMNPFEDLQNQMTVKTLKIQTLQSENHSIQQKLRQESANYSDLERKFEVADAEIIYLTTEKDRLEQTVLSLEKQVKELEISRNEARKSSSEMASQYLRIVEMAGRLHTRDVGSENPSSQQDEQSHQKIEESAEDSHQARILVLEQEIKLLRSRNLRLENGATAAKQATQNVEWILKNALEESES